MSNNKHYQLIELENEELRIRLKDLQKQLDAAEAKLVQLQTPNEPQSKPYVFHLEALPPTQIGNKYQIVDERGFLKDSFYCESDESAIAFFHKYQKEYTPTETKVIMSNISSGVYSSLNEIKFKYISEISSELELKENVSYVFCVGKETVHYFPKNTLVKDAIYMYFTLLSDYTAKSESKTHENRILI